MNKMLCPSLQAAMSIRSIKVLFHVKRKKNILSPVCPPSLSLIDITQQYSPGSTIYDNVWEDITKTADRFNDPGHFTALIGYEWTSVPKGYNLHCTCNITQW